MLAERNRLVREAKKDQKEPEVPAEEKKEPENSSGGVNGYLPVGVGGLAVSEIGVYNHRKAIKTTL